MTSSNVDHHRFVRTEFDYVVEKLTQVTIPLDDNVKLAATIWMPTSYTLFMEKDYIRFLF
jgi:predicted acyl esterase